MESDEIEQHAKRWGLVVLIVLFTATTAHPGKGYETGSATLERVVPPAPTVELAPGTSEEPATVRDNLAQVSQPERCLGAYIALHREALTRLLLGEPERSYNGQVCGAGKNEGGAP